MLPSGEDDNHGVLQVERVVSNLILCMESRAVVPRARVLQGYAEELSSYCDPGENGSSFRHCQAAAIRAIDPLLMAARDARQATETRKDTLTGTRVAAFDALARICFDNAEAASTAAESIELLEAAVIAALKPAEQVQQQQEHLAALHLVQAIGAAVPEAPALRTLLPAVAAMAVQLEEQEPDSRAATMELLHSRVHPAFRSVRTTALEVLVSCSLGRKCRESVSASLPESRLHAILADTWDDSPVRAFTVSLLCANLCDLEVPADAVAEGYTGRRFDEEALSLWTSIGFFEDIASCLSAALEMLPWPPQSQIYHRPWKLLNTILRLVLAGHAQQLIRAVEPLVTCVLRRLPENDAAGLVSADEARAARLAAQALLGLAINTEAVNVLRQSSSLPDALRCMINEEPAAAELLELVVGTAWQNEVMDGSQIHSASSPPFQAD